MAFVDQQVRVWSLNRLAWAIAAVVKADREGCVFEINNPTDRTLKCIVRPAKGFDLTGRWKRKLTLPAGALKVVAVGL